VLGRGQASRLHQAAGGALVTGHVTRLGGVACSKNGANMGEKGAR
jgi:hypothetical protein